MSTLSSSLHSDYALSTSSSTFDHGVYTDFTHVQVEDLVYIAVSERDRAGGCALSVIFSLIFPNSMVGRSACGTIAQVSVIVQILI